MNATILAPFAPVIVSFPRFKRATGNETVTFNWYENPLFVAGMSLLVVAVIISLITLGFCLGRRYCCKAPSVVLNAGSPLPFWHRAWNTMGVYRPCGGHHRCATSHYCSRTHC
ncbi:hypothetical protein PRIPAC_82494 [Pristionchus pacificus]|nr:hypothetical protein PRIPAC_82494 [Pristionchus pacificus]